MKRFRGANQPAARLAPRRVWLALALAAIAGGCGDQEKTHTVRGKVTLKDGSPLTKGVVVFESDEYEAFGDIQEDGSYELTSYEPGDGIPKGTYRVRLEVRGDGSAIEEESPDAPTRLPVPEKYESGATSGLECVVDGDRTFNIRIE